MNQVLYFTQWKVACVGSVVMQLGFSVKDQILLFQIPQAGDWAELDQIRL